MSLRPSFKLSLPVAALALLIAFAAWPGVRPQTAEAAVSSITAAETDDSDGGTISITAVAQDDAGNLTIVATGGGAATALAIFSCDIPVDTGEVCADTDGSATGILIVTTAIDTGIGADLIAETLTVVLTLTLDCVNADATVITITATQTTSDSVEVICGDRDVVIEKQAVDTNFDYDFDWDVTSGGDCAVVVNATIDSGDDGNFDLEDGDQAEFFCDDNVTLVVGEQDDATFAGIDDCDEGDPGVDDISGDRVTFDISDIGSTAVRCTWVNDEDLLVTPTVVVGPVTSVQVTAGNIAFCGGTTAVQVTLRNASGGPAPAGTSVTATSSAGGTFQPATTLTGTFPFSFATFLYQAPATFSGVATIRVTTNNGVSGTVNIQVVCGATTAPAPVVTAGPLKPPSAGDGGLLGNSGNSNFDAYVPSALAASAAALVMGLTLASRRRTAVTVPVASVSTPVRPAQSAASGGGGFAILLSLALIGLTMFFKRPRQ